MVDGYKLFSIFATATPFLVLAAAVAMLLVAGFDQGFKPCPNSRMVPSKCTSSRYSRCYANMKYNTFCGQTMHPRVTMCCRVPCFQNFTTYFDADGNPDDCYSQTFVDMSIALGGFALLGVSLFWFLLLWGVCILYPRFCKQDDHRRPAQQDAAAAAAVREGAAATADSRISSDCSRSALDVEEVQVL
jgi:hypothetical protein